MENLKETPLWLSLISCINRFEEGYRPTAEVLNEYLQAIEKKYPVEIFQRKVKSMTWYAKSDISELSKSVSKIPAAKSKPLPDWDQGPTLVIPEIDFMKIVSTMRYISIGEFLCELE